MKRQYLLLHASIRNVFKAAGTTKITIKLHGQRRSLTIPSTIDTGFVLSLPKLSNPATSDAAYQRVLAGYLPSWVLDRLRPRLERFGREAISGKVNEWISNAERQPPYVKSRNVWGELYAHDRLVTSEGWKRLGKWGIANGVVAAGYEPEFGQYRRLVQHAFNYIYSASSAVYSCPVSMTSGAARLLAHQLPCIPADHPFHEVYNRITARENNWISSQWMTERPGGSDVHNSETVAVYSPVPEVERSGMRKLDQGDWLVSGYKFFCSATDCDIALMLAKTTSGELSLFLAPTKRFVQNESGDVEHVTNGIRFHRLKNKMGTKELPTAELELRNVRAWLVGPLDRGIATIAALLNVTRTHNFITALSCWRRGMAIAKSFASVRTTIDQPLATFPMHLHLLADMEVKFQGLLQMAFFTTSLLSFADNGVPEHRLEGYPPVPESGEQLKVVHRALTASGKAVICKLACISLQECQEAMGGVGYLDEPDEPDSNISRLYRDTAANMTWEGTTNVLASEVVRYLTKAKNLTLFSNWYETAAAQVTEPEWRAQLQTSWAVVREKLSIATEESALKYALSEGREIMFSLAWAVSGLLLALDAQRDRDAVAKEVARRWIMEGRGGVGEFVLRGILPRQPLPTEAMVDFYQKPNWDCQIVWSQDLPSDAAWGYRRRVKLTSIASEKPEDHVARH